MGVFCLLKLLGAAQLILTSQFKKLKDSEQCQKTSERKQHLCGGKTSVKISFYTIVKVLNCLCLYFVYLYCKRNGKTNLTRSNVAVVCMLYKVYCQY